MALYSSVAQGLQRWSFTPLSTSHSRKKLCLGIISLPYYNGFVYILMLFTNQALQQFEETPLRSLLYESEVRTPA